MSIRDRLSGNEAIATAMRQINPDVFAMFPITPSTERRSRRLPGHHGDFLRGPFLHE